MRGTYGNAIIGGSPEGGSSSWASWLVGGLVVAGGVFLLKRQADQITKLSTAAGIPQQSLLADVRSRTAGLVKRFSPKGG